MSRRDVLRGALAAVAGTAVALSPRDGAAIVKPVDPVVGATKSGMLGKKILLDENPYCPAVGTCTNVKVFEHWRHGTQIDNRKKAWPVEFVTSSAYFQNTLREPIIRSLRIPYFGKSKAEGKTIDHVIVGFSDAPLPTIQGITFGYERWDSPASQDDNVDAFGFELMKMMRFTDAQGVEREAWRLYEVETGTPFTAVKGFDETTRADESPITWQVRSTHVHIEKMFGVAFALVNKNDPNDRRLGRLFVGYEGGGSY